MTPYGPPLILATIVVGVIIAVTLSLRAFSQRSGLRFDAESAPIRLQGRGTYATESLDLPAGPYRLDYHFSEEWATAVYLVSGTFGDNDLLLYKTGEGSATFNIDADEQVVVQIEPTAEDVEWEIELVALRSLPNSDNNASVQS